MQRVPVNTGIVFEVELFEIIEQLRLILNNISSIFSDNFSDISLVPLDVEWHIWIVRGDSHLIYVGRDPSLIKHIQHTIPTNNGTRERRGQA